MLDAAVQAASVRKAEIGRSDDDYWRRCELGILAELGKELKSIHFWHHEIEEDEISPLVGQSVQRFAAIGRDAYCPAFADKQPPHHLAGIQIILDDERARCPGHGLEAIEQLGELHAVHRLRQI